jgi:hypothetical protein
LSSSEHRIQLAGPWTICFRDKSGQSFKVRQSFNQFFSALNRTRRDDWLVERGGLLELARQFNCPTGLNCNTRVFLEFESELPICRITLNERAVAAKDGLSSDLSEQMVSGQNRLVIAAEFVPWEVSCNDLMSRLANSSFRLVIVAEPHHE